jgi:hypothetical protein
MIPSKSKTPRQAHESDRNASGRNQQLISADSHYIREIAAYLKRSEAVVRERITALPGFPQAIRLPVAGSKGRGQPLWKAKEVIAWTEKHQENRIA